MPSLPFSRLFLIALFYACSVNAFVVTNNNNNLSFVGSKRRGASTSCPRDFLPLFMAKKQKKKKKKKQQGGFGGSGDDETYVKKKSSPIMEIDLVAEPEGGVELSLLGGVIDADDGGFQLRMKDMGVDSSEEVLQMSETELDGAQVHNFWLKGLASGAEVSRCRNSLLKDAVKNANFPGFRKGQVPPYAQPKITNFAVQESFVGGCKDALAQFGVASLEPDENSEFANLGQVIFHEDVEDISIKYNTKTCPSVPFTATFRGTFLENPNDAAAADDASVIDAAIEEAVAASTTETVEK